jgi:hypothetical protein
VSITVVFCILSENPPLLFSLEVPLTARKDLIDSTRHPLCISLLSLKEIIGAVKNNNGATTSKSKISK